MVQDYITQEEGEGLFFDSRDDISSVTDPRPNSPPKNGLTTEEQFISWPTNDSHFDVWSKDPVSVRERRDKFLKVLGLGMMDNPLQEPEVPDEEHKENEEVKPDFDRVISNCGAVLRTSSSGNDYSMSSCSTEDASTSYYGISEDSFMRRVKNLDDSTVFAADELGKDSNLTSLKGVCSNRTLTLHEFDRDFGSSSSIERPMRQKDDSSSTPKTSLRTRIRWLMKLCFAACNLDGRGEDSDASISNSCRSGIDRVGRVKVHSYRSQSKELSAVYEEQGFRAHDGAILTMKFSPNGQYLATGGEDSVVRVWHVTECERTNEMDLLENDPSCLYFAVNHSSELTPLCLDKVKKSKPRITRLSSDSVCVIIPPDAFQLLQAPLHEFHGHEGDVLDLSWSTNKCLLSSSVDKTVRMWQVGSNTCLRVFQHNDYVTCVQFNPINENYFISGSIDGKVRVWEISKSYVVDWLDIREIVTAVCYYPDGKGAVVGTLAGNCRFYGASDNRLQLDAQVSLHGKKKFPFNRITGFQFCPNDPHELMVASADSQIRILYGIDVVSKLKGTRNCGSQISASFTADGHHIVSATEDSNVYMWSYASHAASMSSNAKSTWSRERFFSSNASVAIPWSGFQSRISSVCAASGVLQSEKYDFRENDPVLSYGSNSHIEDSLGNNTLCLPPSSSFPPSHGLLEFLPKSSATWPEEKLPFSFSASALQKSHYKFLKISCQNTSHAWGQVIVTAGFDGWIRSYQNYGLPQHL
ncbi:hypothetical protein Cni_G14998 [Canna indica]|uniref:Uncharacterized protein n=1 Tax=Canna indica TaxID=4628 RepID=A0AAQ3KIS0_9LILI|nr:hypothetical protein Cni_G14998 [Canna indica]